MAAPSITLYHVLSVWRALPLLVRNVTSHMTCWVLVRPITGYHGLLAQAGHGGHCEVHSVRKTGTEHVHSVNGCSQCEHSLGGCTLSCLKQLLVAVQPCSPSMATYLQVYPALHACIRLYSTNHILNIPSLVVIGLNDAQGCMSPGATLVGVTIRIPVSPRRQLRRSCRSC
jgi:hypothetical protein